MHAPDPSYASAPLPGRLARAWAHRNDPFVLTVLFGVVVTGVMGRCNDSLSERHAVDAQMRAEARQHAAAIREDVVRVTGQLLFAYDAIVKVYRLPGTALERETVVDRFNVVAEAWWSSRASVAVALSQLPDSGATTAFGVLAETLDSLDVSTDSLLLFAVASANPRRDRWVQRTDSLLSVARSRFDDVLRATWNAQ